MDDRWEGQFGIGRFATEVLARLTLGMESIATSTNPLSLRGMTSVKSLKLSSADVIYSPGFNLSLSRARQLITLHDLIHLHPSSKISRLRALYLDVLVRWAVKHCGVVLTVSHVSAAAIKEWLGSSTVEIVVAGCGRSASFAPPGPRRSFSRPTFVIVSSIRPHKNVEVLLEACVLRPDYDLVLVTLDTALAATLIDKWGLRDRVSVESGLTDGELSALYRGATGAVVPSLLEGFGLPALEAMSCGTRVAHWRECESVAEICGPTSVTVDHIHQASSWAEALDRLVQLGPLTPEELSPEWWNTHSWDSVAAIVNATLLDVVGRRKTSA